MEISLVAIGRVAGLIPSLLPYLKESQDWTRGRATVDDILRMVLNGQMQLWVVYQDGIVYGHVVTEIKQYPQCNMLTIQYCAMQTGTLEQIEDKMHETAERFARDAGCKGIEFVGRPGWRRTGNMYGYSVQSVMYQKFFKD
jgi:hypothetical protein